MELELGQFSVQWCPVILSHQRWTLWGIVCDCCKIMSYLEMLVVAGDLGGEGATCISRYTFCARVLSSSQTVIHSLFRDTPSETPLSPLFIFQGL